MALPEDVKKALLAVLAGQDLCTEVRELLGTEESERDITQLKEIVEAQQIKLTRTEHGVSSQYPLAGGGGGRGLYSPPVYFPS